MRVGVVVVCLRLLVVVFCWLGCFSGVLCCIGLFVLLFDIVAYYLIVLIDLVSLCFSLIW